MFAQSIRAKEVKKTWSAQATWNLVTEIDIVLAISTERERVICSYILVRTELREVKQIVPLFTLGTSLLGPILLTDNILSTGDRSIYTDFLILR